MTIHGAAERHLPQNLDAERSVLGAILLHNELYPIAARILNPGDFYRAAHMDLFRVMATILDAPGGVVDLLTLQDALRAKGRLDEVGGPAYLTALVDGIPRSTNVEHYAQIVKDKSLLRAVIAAGSAMIDMAYEEEPAADILARSDTLLLSLQRGRTASALQSTASSNPALRELLEQRVSHRGELSGVETGFRSINELTGGWQRGDLIVLAARPSIGKTTLALNHAAAAARMGQPVAIFSLEMRRQQLEARLLSSLSGVPLSALLGGLVVGPEQWAALSGALAHLQDWPIWIDDTASRTVREIRWEARRLHAERRLGLIIVDYVQLMPGTTERRGATRNEEITDISRRLKVLAGELEVPILLLSQLSRAADGRSDPKPRLSDLRESGALEQDADLVCFLHRRHHRESGWTEFIIEKQRNGPCGAVALTMEREQVRFLDGGGEEPPLPAAEKKAQDRDARTRAIIRQRAKRSA